MIYEKQEISSGRLQYQGFITKKIEPSEKDKSKFVYIENDRPVAYTQNTKLRNLVLTSIMGRCTEYSSGKFLIFVRNNTDGKTVRIPESFDTRSAAETAARACSCFFDEVHVIHADYKAPKSLKTAEDDPEEWDRFYEDNGIIRGMHPEQNT